MTVLRRRIPLDHCRAILHFHSHFHGYRDRDRRRRRRGAAYAAVASLVPEP
jgi:hypothetical protein